MHARETPAERRTFRLLAIIVAAAVVPLLLVVARVGGRDGFVELGQVALTSVLFLGKFVIFLGATDDRIFGPIALALMCVAIDVVFAIALGGGLERLERAPLVGRGLRGARLRALRVVTRYPGLEGIAFLGVVGFVLLPLAATEI